jgi:hypothetical protein
MTTLEETFRLAWAEAEGDSFADQLTRQSLEASAMQVPELVNVVFELKHRHQAELDLHLDGETVTGHATDAQKFAIFVKGIADAVKEITKSVSGRKSMTSTLLVSAPAPGSVRVVFRAAPPEELDGHIALARSETEDSNSLRVVATVLARADDDGPSGDVIDGLLAELPGRARGALTRIANAVSDAEWTVSGTLRRPKHAPAKLELTPAGARRLRTALAVRDIETAVTTLDGYVDGQRRSIDTMWFSPTAGTPFEASVLSKDLLQQVAALGAANDKVRATFTVVTKSPPGTSGAARRSYALTAIEAANEQPSLVDE